MKILKSSATATTEKKEKKELNFGEKSQFRQLISAIWKSRATYLLLIPGLIWLFIFAYLPMGGLSLAFKNYKANLGIWGSPWVGFQNFEYLFRDVKFWESIWKTLYINCGRMLFQFPAPIIMALIINEFRMKRYKKVLQTVYTFPHFLSRVIVASIATNIFSRDGLINQLVMIPGGEPINFLGRPSSFIPLLYITDIWKYAGYGAIIYLATISGIDTEQYEAADIDGATRLQKLFRITIPNLMPTVIVMFIMTMGSLMSQGFDQIFNMRNAAVQESVEVLDTYIYRVTFLSSADFGFSTAASLFRSLTNALMLILADRGSKLMGGGGLFG